jgi:hypothetical protein
VACVSIPAPGDDAKTNPDDSSTEDTDGGDGPDHSEDGTTDAGDDDSGTTDSGDDGADPGDSGETTDTGEDGTTDTDSEPLEYEICDNGFDDDWNGFADCVDPECSTTDSCACIDEDAGDLLGTLWTGEISGNGDDAQGPCTATGGGEDIQFTWTPPEDGCYELTTAGSEFDTTLAVGDAWCGGEILACNDDAGGLHSTVTVSAQAGRSILVLADAYDQYSEGNLVVSVQAGPPFTETDDLDAGSDMGAAIATGDLADATTTIGHDCADVTGPSGIIRWEAPASGTWSFTTTGSDFDAAVTVFGQCATALTCDDYRAGDDQADARVLLSEGDVVHLAVGGVDGETGTWVLNVAGPE